MIYSIVIMVDKGTCETLNHRLEQQASVSSALEMKSSEHFLQLQLKRPSPPLWVLPWCSFVWMFFTQQSWLSRHCVVGVHVNAASQRGACIWGCHPAFSYIRRLRIRRRDDAPQWRLLWGLAACKLVHHCVSQWLSYITDNTSMACVVWNQRAVTHII